MSVIPKEYTNESKRTMPLSRKTGESLVGMPGHGTSFEVGAAIGTIHNGCGDIMEAGKENGRLKPGVLIYFHQPGNASVAQGIEHRSPKAGVGRSNRPGGTRCECRPTSIPGRPAFFVGGIS